MGTLADLLIPLAGSISNEKALKMREACDALEARVSNLEAATKNIAVATDETLRAVRLNAGEGASTREGDVRVSADAERSPSPASSVPANATGKVSMQIHETVEDGKLISVDVCPMLPDQMASHGFASFYGPNARAEAERYLASRATAPATGEVPAWIPSVEEMLELIDDGREGDLISLIASRAPAAPVVDVRRLLVDAGFCDEWGTPAPFRVQPMREALHAQNVRTVQP